MKESEKGIGVVAILIIVAVIGVGGVAAVQTYNKAQVNVDTTEVMAEKEAEVEEAKEQAQDDLVQAKAAIATDLNLAISTIAGIRANLAKVAIGASASAQAELQVLDDKIAEVQADVVAESTTAAAMIDEVIIDIESSIEHTTDNHSHADHSSEDKMEKEAETTEDSSNSATVETKSESSASVEMNEDETAIGVESTTEADMTTDVEDVIEAEAMLDSDTSGSLGL